MLSFWLQTTERKSGSAHGPGVSSADIWILDRSVIAITDGSTFCFLQRLKILRRAILSRQYCMPYAPSSKFTWRVRIKDKDVLARLTPVPSLVASKMPENVMFFMSNFGILHSVRKVTLRLTVLGVNPI